MILYFADRKMNILGLASTGLRDGLAVYNDKRTEELSTGSASISFDLKYDGSAKALMDVVEVGNYVLLYDGQDSTYYTIIDMELDTASHTISVYAEGGGLDLLNEVVGAYSASSAMSIAAYVAVFAADSGFEIGINEVSDLSRTLSWDGESTVTERLQSLAKQFDAEISYTFEIEGMSVTKKCINFFKHRGLDTGITIRIGTAAGSIRVKKSIENLATALLPTGDNITLSGYSYDDGDIYIDGQYLKSRSALAKWSRYLSPTEQGDGDGHIVRPYSYQTSSQSELCNRSVTQLKKVSVPEVSYEVKIEEVPENMHIGDECRIVDARNELYLKARLIKTIRSDADGTCEATFDATEYEVNT